MVRVGNNHLNDSTGLVKFLYLMRGICCGILYFDVVFDKQYDNQAYIGDISIISATLYTYQRLSQFYQRPPQSTP